MVAAGVDVDGIVVLGTVSTSKSNVGSSFTGVARAAARISAEGKVGLVGGVGNSNLGRFSAGIAATTRLAAARVLAKLVAAEGEG